MTTTRYERKGQIEFGIIEHNRHEFVAIGASTIGREITSYTKETKDGIKLTTWNGKTMLDCRYEIVERYWTGALALMFRLSNNRFIVGYALGENGMLFRGELIYSCDEDDARQTARCISHCFADLDAEDEEAFHDELLEV